MKRWTGWLLIAAAWLGLGAGAALAAPRASLDRDRIAMGETVTLTIETDRNGGAPDLSPLDADFIRRGVTNSSQTSIINGEVTSRTLYGVALEPRREGVISIPRLTVGDETTDPLALTVVPERIDSARAGDPVFIEGELETDSPYVQQSVAYTVRLYYAVTLLDGQLETPTPDDVALQRIGEDVTYQRSVAGRRYNVVERRFLLTPERSGEIAVPAPRFRGRTLSGGFDSLMGNGGVTVTAGSPQTLQVRPQPTGAPQPWLPARGLEISAEAPPEEGRSGEPALVSVTLRVDGATASQLPDLQYPEVEGAKVFPEPPETREQWQDGRVQSTLTRRFAIVPQRPGPLEVPALQVGWWDTGADRARSAEVPGFHLEVAAGAGVPAAPVAAPVAADRAGAMPMASAWPWQLATAVLALCCLALGAWGWRRGATADNGRTRAAGAAPTAAPAAPRVALDRALREGDLQAVAAALAASVGVGAGAHGNLEQVAARLDDPAQRDAVDALARALWGRGDPAAAREALRAAFRGGPRWRASPAVNEGVLPALYPRR
ncbi:BatD family protein [Coralloluteibacterium stylophorae]|uniref:Protein BatD n=1 Tax=Coralloluteibacterium stylophorae TaxID=1776034 RepID=A0A8J7VVP0_9GAMM|nr:BatD family protein [Coralloluteibacterium stylophorae]MBS7458386.1 protein BatD [Coralloluteibacterium stylophorae]